MSNGEDNIVDQHQWTNGEDKTTPLPYLLHLFNEQTPKDKSAEGNQTTPAMDQMTKFSNQ